MLYGANSFIILIASLGVQAVLASTRTTAFVTSRIALMISRSCLVPTLILRIGYSFANNAFFAISVGVSMPMVKEVCGVCFGFSPKSLYNGTFSILQTRSYSAISTAAFADGLCRRTLSKWRII